MPIRDLSDRTGALPTIGELRKGEPKGETEKNGRKVPVIGRDLNEAFRFTADHPLIEEAFVKLYGDRPLEIPCLLAGNTTDQVFEAWQEEFSASTLLHRCDGQQVVYQYKGGKRETWELGEGPPCPYALLQGSERPREACEPHGRLKIIPVTVDSHGGSMRVANLRRIGQVLVLTTSKHDIKNIAECLHWYEQIHGTLAGIPFVLRRTPVDISMPRGDGVRVRGKKWLIDLTPSADWVTLQLEGQRQRAFSAVPGAVAALKAADVAAPVAVEERPHPAIEAEDDEDLDGFVERSIDHQTGEITGSDDPDEDEPDELDRTLAEHANTGPVRARPAWAETPLGRQVSALVDALDEAKLKYQLPSDEASEAEIQGWIASKRGLLQQRQPVGTK